MLKIKILEDQPEQMNRLKDMLRSYAQAHPGFVYELQTYTEGIALLTDYHCDTDLLFMDIQLPDILGIDAAKRIRQMDEKVMIIFITMLTQYAIEGYAVRAFDYVLKPVRYEEFSAKMDRACRMLSHQNSSLSLELRTKEDIRRISADEITYIEVANHDVLIHTDREVIRQWGSLKSFEEQLAGAHFVRCNACYLVNLRYVRGVSGDRVRVGEEELAVSRAKRKDFLTSLAQYKGGSR